MAELVITIIGGGLAGCEAAWQAAQRGMKVRLYEMRPHKMTPAHHTGYLAELVCSNSLRANALENAVGLLKEEMRRLDSLIMRCADACAVPAGGALAVDREQFALAVTRTLMEHPLVELVNLEVTAIPEARPLVIATGPLTADALAAQIGQLTGTDYLHFFDAAAPIVTRESVDEGIAFWASRYGKGDADYLNCPMTKEEYEVFYEALIHAETHQPKEFEGEVFEGCMPIEVMAKRGPQTLLFGPLKPVGLVDPRTGRQPYAVVQLRKDNREGTLLNIVGFQTSLKWGEQRKVVRLIPGLQQAEIVRYGVMHRDTYLTSPLLLSPTLQLRTDPGIFFAGQITGVEGYVESAANGLVAGINAARLGQGRAPVVFPPETAIGALCHYITTAEPQHFQPMNVTFGIMPPLPQKIRDKKAKNALIAARALDALAAFQQQAGLCFAEDVDK